MFRIPHLTHTNLFYPLVRGRSVKGGTTTKWHIKMIGAWLGMFAILIVCSGQARADSVFIDNESDPNNNNPLVGQWLSPNDGTISLTGSVGRADLLDAFRFSVMAGNKITVNSLTSFSLDNLTFFVPAADGEEDVLYPSGSSYSFTAPANGTVGFIVFGDESLANYKLNITGLTPTAASVPEPVTILLLGTGLAGVAARVRKRKSRKA